MVELSAVNKVNVIIDVDELSQQRKLNEILVASDKTFFSLFSSTPDGPQTTKLEMLPTLKKARFATLKLMHFMHNVCLIVDSSSLATAVSWTRLHVRSALCAFYM